MRGRVLLAPAGHEANRETTATCIACGGYEMTRASAHLQRLGHVTAATREAGVHPKVVSERLGHSTISITLDLDSHVIPSMQREAAAALDDVLASGR